MEHVAVQIVEVVRMLVSCLCGLAIGFERQNHIRLQHRKSAGMRTHMLVCVASAAMMLISKYGFLDMLTYGDNVRVDVSRVAAAIVSGVGFLGAGIIYVRRESIKGLTTAAGLWATSAVGMAVGCGMYAVGIALTALVVIIQELSKSSLYHDGKKWDKVVIELENQPETAEQVIQWIRDQGVEIHSVSSVKADKDIVSLTLRVSFGETADKDILLRLHQEQPSVKTVEF